MFQKTGAGGLESRVMGQGGFVFAKNKSSKF